METAISITFQKCNSFNSEFNRFMKKKNVRCTVKSSLHPTCLTDVSGVSFVSAAGIGQLLQSVRVPSTWKLCRKTHNRRRENNIMFDLIQEVWQERKKCQTGLYLSLFSIQALSEFEKLVKASLGYKSVELAEQLALNS